jgi:hypothetical protein
VSRPILRDGAREAIMTHTDATFENQDVVVDDAHYVRCRFTRCRLLYHGGPIPRIDDCQMLDCTWHFEEAAQRTLEMLRAIYHGLEGAGQHIVEGAFDSIRAPRPPHAPGPFATNPI